ncbi:MAG TPA: cobalamin biosynthesis protein [Oscillatoriales cyanobacterium M59_W2019_021]|nr:cobalamin biosynthesis protein [Oscillatoriales cyanobacterium M4454_W2019_049]HIK51856.1 cobalamin biosynthesis protein [Oscillatoriales cyanobacterium M59_W2019_021]
MTVNWMPIAVLAIASGLDYLIGDPWGWIHPVQAIGWTIDRGSGIILDRLKRPSWRWWAGGFLAISTIGGSGFFAWGAIATAERVHPLLGSIIASILLASCFAGRSLRHAALDVLQPLTFGDLTAARTRLALYVGRDTEGLTEAEILRAVLETVSENATDGVMAPLFYALLGLGIPAIGSVPLALAYKAASTLDSMVGYPEEPYTHLGWWSAKIEDVLTWLPCRLTVVTLGLLTGKLGRVWRLCRRDAILDPSPNSGWSECAYAAILGVQLGGRNWYRGKAKEKPLLGEADRPITPEIVLQALQLTRTGFLVWLLLVIGGWLVVSG